MNKYLLFLLFMLCSCSTLKYYVFTTDAPVTVYEIRDLDAVMMTIPAGEQIIATAPTSTYRIINYKDYSGFVTSRTFPNERIYKTKTFKQPISSKQYANREELKSLKASVTNTQASPGAKTVPVKGYYRKNGTYVKPYYRRPTRKN